MITADEVIDWAKQFLAKAEEELTGDEVKEQKKYASLVQTPEYKTFLSRMPDESSQIRDNGKLNRRVRRLIREYGIPDFLDIALKPENIKACHVGVASHNYFSIAYAHLLAEKHGVSEYVTFEMPEGMANNLPRVMRKRQKHIILYTPVVKSGHFLNAISCLVRRPDENTGRDNFLSYTFFNK
jgi:hypothetical protein